jgi:hypothetical protein
MACNHAAGFPPPQAELIKVERMLPHTFHESTVRLWAQLKKICNLDQRGFLATGRVLTGWGKDGFEGGIEFSAKAVKGS